MASPNSKLIDLYRIANTVCVFDEISVSMWDVSDLHISKKSCSFTDAFRFN